jgi:RND family efflux transporter MFP subunit
MDRPLKLMATVPERFSGVIQAPQDGEKPQRVDIWVEAYPREVFSGIVSRVNPTVDPANRTFHIEVLVANETRRLKAGSFAKATIYTHEEAGVATAPEEALVSFAGVTKVFVVRDGKAHAVPVKTGVRQEIKNGTRKEQWVEVSGELEPGSRVVTSGHSQLAEDTPVRIRGE